MEKEKLKILAKKISIKFDPKDDIQSIFWKFSTKTSQNKDYFSKFSYSEIIQIFLYLFSLLKTSDFKLGEKLIQDSSLVGIFEYDEETFENIECDDCGGNGSVSCDYCGGDGTIDCDTCNADGEIDCETCSGNGEIDCEQCSGDGIIDGEECDACSGSGYINCTSCAGSGKVSCDDCDGDGNVSCQNCNMGSVDCDTCERQGYQETNKNGVILRVLLVWEQNLIEEFFYKKEMKQPLANFKLENFLKLEAREVYSLVRGYKSEEYYCYEIIPLLEDDSFFSTSNGTLTNDNFIENKDYFFKETI